MKYTHPETFKIYSFNKGDIITKIYPSQIKTSHVELKDVNFIGYKLIFLGIANGSIYLERTSTMEKLLNGQTFFIPLCNYEEGWSYYEEPVFMKGKSDIMTMMEKSMLSPQKAALKKLHEKAILDENYTLAAKIQKKLKKIKEDDNEEIDLENPEDIFGRLGNMFGGEMKFGPDSNLYDNPEDEDGDD